MFVAGAFALSCALTALILYPIFLSLILLQCGTIGGFGIPRASYAVRPTVRSTGCLIGAAANSIARSTSCDVASHRLVSDPISSRLAFFKVSNS